MKRTMIFLGVFAMIATMASAELKILDTAEEFERVIQESTVPVVVQFSAYWCNPCQSLKRTLINVSSSYSDDKILLCYVDAYVNTSLKKYLDGGYPTVRTFKQGKTAGDHFVGSKSESFVRTYVDRMITGKATSSRGELKIIETAEEFDNVVQNSTVPVVVQFSAYWCNPCKSLKKTLINVASDYSPNEIMICYVDAYVNTSLKKYLDGGYPTVRTFKQGKAAGDHFVGSKSESFVRGFLDKAMGKVSALGGLKTIETTQEFDRLIQTAKVPVVVQFSAYWCGPCKNLKKTLINVVPDYAEDKVLVCYVDAYVNTALKKYLDGGYPTVRTFKQGKAAGDHFVGSQSESFVRNFLDKAMSK